MHFKSSIRRLQRNNINDTEIEVQLYSHSSVLIWPFRQCTHFFEVHTRRDVTNREDGLRALFALADVFHEKTKCHSLTGLWYDEAVPAGLAYLLCWQP